MRILILLLVVGLIWPVSLSASATLPLIESEDLDGTFHWRYIELPEVETAKEHAMVAFKNFFEYGQYCVPTDVEVLTITLNNGHLILNVSKEIWEYGGSAFEIALVEQLLKIASTVPEVSEFTLKIEGIVQPLVQGLELDRVCVWARL